MTALRLVIANIAVFLTLRLVWLLWPAQIDATVMELALPSGAGAFIARPWTALTYMFLHVSFWHMLVNVLWLAWFGTLLERVAGGKVVLADYLAGGVAGAVAYMFFSGYATAAGGTQLAGASAATFAIVTAALVSAPDRKVEFAFSAKISLRWVAVAGLAVFVCASVEMSGAQTAAHCAGTLAGVASALLWRKVTRRRMERMKASARERLAHRSLLEKARRTGYGSLTRDEKVRLFRGSGGDVARRAAPLP